MKRRLSSEGEDLPPTKKQKITTPQNTEEIILPDDCLRIIVEKLPYNMLAQMKLVSKAVKIWADEIFTYKLLSDFGLQAERLKDKRILQLKRSLDNSDFLECINHIRKCLNSNPDEEYNETVLESRLRAMQIESLTQIQRHFSINQQLNPLYADQMHPILKKIIFNEIEPYQLLSTGPSEEYEDELTAERFQCEFMLFGATSKYILVECAFSALFLNEWTSPNEREFSVNVTLLDLNASEDVNGGSKRVTLLVNNLEDGRYDKRFFKKISVKKFSGMDLAWYTSEDVNTVQKWLDIPPLSNESTEKAQELFCEFLLSVCTPDVKVSNEVSKTISKDQISQGSMKVYDLLPNLEKLCLADDLESWQKIDAILSKIVPKMEMIEKLNDFFEAEPSTQPDLFQCKDPQICRNELLKLLDRSIFYNSETLHPIDGDDENLNFEAEIKFNSIRDNSDEFVVLKLTKLATEDPLYNGVPNYSIEYQTKDNDKTSSDIIQSLSLDELEKFESKFDLNRFDPKIIDELAGRLGLTYSSNFADLIAWILQVPIVLYNGNMLKLDLPEEDDENENGSGAGSDEEYRY